MAMEQARAKEREGAIHEFRRSAAGDARASILHHCPSLDALADDFLRTPDLACDTWEFAPDVSTQCEKVMTFAAEQNLVSNVGLAMEIDWQEANGRRCADRAAAFTTKGQRGTPTGTVQDGRRVLIRQGGAGNLFCNAVMRLITSQCLVGSRNRTTLENYQKNQPRGCGGLAASD